MDQKWKQVCGKTTLEPDTSYETLHGSLHVNPQVYPKYKCNMYIGSAADQGCFSIQEPMGQKDSGSRIQIRIKEFKYF
jgi:hypothetical protein